MLWDHREFSGILCSSGGEFLAFRTGIPGGPALYDIRITNNSSIFSILFNLTEIENVYHSVKFYLYLQPAVKNKVFLKTIDYWSVPVCPLF